MSIGPFSVGAVLGVIATLVGAGIPVYMRYVWGAKSHVAITRFATLEDSEWRDGRNDDVPIWTRRCIVKASNSGWRDGVVTGVDLTEVIVSGDDGTEAVRDPAAGVHKIELEHFATSGEMTRLDLRQRTSYVGQIIGGRDDEMMAIIPFILQDSEVGQVMKSSNRGVFTFTFTVEDEKRVYKTDVVVRTSLESSAGGRYRRRSSDSGSSR